MLSRSSSTPHFDLSRWFTPATSTAPAARPVPPPPPSVPATRRVERLLVRLVKALAVAEGILDTLREDERLEHLPDDDVWADLQETAGDLYPLLWQVHLTRGVFDGSLRHHLRQRLQGLAEETSGGPVPKQEPGPRQQLEDALTRALDSTVRAESALEELATVIDAAEPAAAATLIDGDVGNFRRDVFGGACSVGMLASTLGSRVPVAVIRRVQDAEERRARRRGE